MGFMNFFKNEDDKEDVKEEDDKPIGGFGSWKEALASMKDDQINKHKEGIKDALEKIKEDKNLDELKIKDLDKLIDEKANYFEDNKDILEEKYKEKDYYKLIYKFSEDIINEYN